MNYTTATLSAKANVDIAILALVHDLAINRIKTSAKIEAALQAPIATLQSGVIIGIASQDVEDQPPVIYYATADGWTDEDPADVVMPAADAAEVVRKEIEWANLAPREKADIMTGAALKVISRRVSNSSVAQVVLGVGDATVGRLCGGIVGGAKGLWAKVHAPKAEETGTDNGRVVVYKKPGLASRMARQAVGSTISAIGVGVQAVGKDIKTPVVKVMPADPNTTAGK